MKAGKVGIALWFILSQPAEFWWIRASCAGSSAEVPKDFSLFARNVWAGWWFVSINIVPGFSRASLCL